MRPLILILLLSGCAGIKPAQYGNKRELGLAEKDGVSIGIRGRSIIVRKEF